MDKPVFTLVEEDFQDLALAFKGRRLTKDEMASAVRYFENGIQWHEVAKVAIDLATE